MSARQQRQRREDQQLRLDGCRRAQENAGQNWSDAQNRQPRKNDRRNQISEMAMEGDKYR